MGLVFGREPSDKFTERLAQLTEEAKHNTQWKRQYMEWERQRTYDFENGKEAGMQQKAVEAAIIAVNEFHASPEDAAKKMNAPLELVREGLKQHK